MANGHSFVNQLQSKTLLPQLAQFLCRPLQREIQRAYVTSTTPGGRSFAPLKKPTGLKPVIGLSDSYVYETVGSSIKITSLKPYATYHDTGTRTIPARTPWPKQIPEEWETRLTPQIERFLTGYFTGQPVPVPTVFPATAEGRGR
jgi:hypothetical protein